MNRLNNKGFAISTILYGILTLTILILMMIFGIMKSSKDMNKDLVIGVEENLNKCVLIEVNFENYIYSNRVFDINKYYDCIGKEQVTYLYGDANEDGEVTEEDAKFVDWHLSIPDDYPLTLRGRVNSDVNLNGIIDMDDANTIQKFLNKEEGYETLPLNH